MAYSKKSLVLNLVLISIAVITSYHAARMVRHAFFMRDQSQEMTAKIEELKIKKQELERELAAIQSKEVIEREAKERLNLKNPGEEVVVVVPEKKDTISTKPPLSFWTKLMSFFMR